MSAPKAYTAKHIFTGHQWLQDHAVLIDNKIISDIVPCSELAPGTACTDLGNHILAPAFIDLQIYGANGKLFSVFSNTEALLSLNQFCNAGGTAFCMPTIATNEPAVLYECIDAVKQYWQHGGEGILGLHIEGPWINRNKRGAHIESLVHSPSMNEVDALLQYGKGVIKIITLAPEVCSREVTDHILASGIKIFAGHSDARYEEALHSFDNGITAVTHLYNAMSPLQHRSPGLVGAAFLHDRVMASIIADGYHVDYAAIKIAKRIMQQRLFAITDAVTSSTEGYYKHQADGDKYTAGGILSGSALTMYKALQNLVKEAGIETGEALRMCSLYPAQAMNLDNRLGCIARGFEARLTVLPENLESGNAQLLVL